MLSLYIHIPFCVQKCLYCGFYSTAYSQKDADDFIAALRLEISGRQDHFQHQEFGSVYLGGGTPSVLSEVQMSRITNMLRDHFCIAKDAEFTVEANPNSITVQDLLQWKEQGVNRLSLGVQSFSDNVLRTLGRPHTALSSRREEPDSARSAWT
jgi:oxygen-independent coproporphyrinogen-3 oxidase